MLLSMFISFLLARKIKGKLYVLLITVVLILVSLFSIGFPSVWRSIGGDIIWQVNLPATPLSFPFHADISEVPYCTIAIHPSPPHPPRYDVKLFFLGLQIESLNFIALTTSHIIFSVSFFLLFNLAGAVLGYWISKTTFIDKLLKKDKSNHVV